MFIYLTQMRVSGSLDYAETGGLGGRWPLRLRCRRRCRRRRRLRCRRRLRFMLMLMLSLMLSLSRRRMPMRCSGQ